MSRPNTYNVTIINELHEAWAVDNGYRPQAPSAKPQAPSVRRYYQKNPGSRSTNQR